jgi:hypothetical protein
MATCSDLTKSDSSATELFSTIKPYTMTTHEMVVYEFGNKFNISDSLSTEIENFVIQNNLSYTEFYANHFSKFLRDNLHLIFDPQCYDTLIYDVRLAYSIPLHIMIPNPFTLDSSQAIADFESTYGIDIFQHDWVAFHNEMYNSYTQEIKPFLSLEEEVIYETLYDMLLAESSHDEFIHFLKESLEDGKLSDFVQSSLEFRLNATRFYKYNILDEYGKPSSICTVWHDAHIYDLHSSRDFGIHTYNCFHCIGFNTSPVYGNFISHNQHRVQAHAFATKNSVLRIGFGAANKRFLADFGVHLEN